MHLKIAEAWFRLRAHGWITGRNIRIETRWTKFDPEETRKYAAELVALAPDVILASGTSTVGPLLRLTRTVPIVFPLAADPVAAGLVESLARPGGNATGFMSFETGISAKWLGRSNALSLHSRASRTAA
jgi:putative ABC transport system substrate-binding protein